MRRIIISVLFLTALTATDLNAQDANLFYFMRGVPQAYQLNPAHQPEFNFFLGLPGLAPLKFNQRVPLGISDILQEADGQTVTFLYNKSTQQEFLNSLKDFNNITTELSFSLASIGFRSGQSYITFDIREKLFTDIGFSKDLMRLPFEGPGEGKHYDVDLDLTMNLYSEWSMGISRKIGDMITVGWRGKLLFGQANVYTPKFNLDVNSGLDEWDINMDAQVRASAPFLLEDIVNVTKAPFDLAFGNFDPDTDGLSTQDMIESALNFSNFGLAMDLGVDVRPFDWLQASLSIVDLGSIRWNEAVITDYNQNFHWDGINGGNLERDFLEEIADSLENMFDQVSTQNTKFRSSIPTRVYIGGAVYPHPRYSFGLLSRTDIYHGRLRQQFTASANLYPIKMLSTTFSYSLIQGKYSSYGLGLALKALPFNLYLISDFGPSLLLYDVNEDVPFGIPIDFRNVNLKIGLNIMFGGQRRSKKAKEPEYDLPLID